MSTFLILLVLVQKGRGGGLSGAFGGMGGQSAFGARAGDTFTKVTVGVATAWIVLCILTAKFIGNDDQSKFETASGNKPRVVTIDPTGAADPAVDPTGGTANPAASTIPSATPDADSTDSPAE